MQTIQAPAGQVYSDQPTQTMQASAGQVYSQMVPITQYVPKQVTTYKTMMRVPQTEYAARSPVPDVPSSPWYPVQARPVYKIYQRVDNAPVRAKRPCTRVLVIGLILCDVFWLTDAGPNSVPG